MKKLLFLLLLVSNIIYGQRSIPRGGDAYNELRLNSTTYGLEWKAKSAASPLTYTASTNTYGIDTSIIATQTDLSINYIPFLNASKDANLNQKNIANLNKLTTDTISAFVSGNIDANTSNITDVGTLVVGATTGEVNYKLDVNGFAKIGSNTYQTKFYAGNQNDSTAFIQSRDATFSKDLGVYARSVTIGRDTATDDFYRSSALSINSITRGFLPPRMTGTQRDAISAPAAGLLIFNTTTSKINYYDGGSWIAVP